MTKDLRKRPWKTLRVIVEVTVPPQSRATENDLKFHVEEAMPDMIPLRRACHSNAQDAAVRVKTFRGFWPWFLKNERGLSIATKKNKKEKRDDEYNGL